MNQKEELLRILSRKIRIIFSHIRLDYSKLQEVRLRINAPVILVYDNTEYFVTEHAELVTQAEDLLIMSPNEMKETMEYISNYSLYAFEKEMKEGFITIQGGHRVGIAGKTILEDEKVKGMKNISFLNIRLSHQVKGCADSVLPYLYNKKEQNYYHTLIISPPRCGKTTLLRDIIRQISDGGRERKGLTVGVVDERSELGACYMGVPQNELGIRTDILDCCPKAKGMMMLIRSMAPSVIAVDEIGSKEDIEAIRYAVNCGCKLITTVHGSTLSDIKTKPSLGELVKEAIFERYVLLTNYHGVGTVSEILDVTGSNLYQRT